MRINKINIAANAAPDKAIATDASSVRRLIARRDGGVVLVLVLVLAVMLVLVGGR